MHCSIGVCTYKRLYPYKQKKYTYFVYDCDCFNNKECDFKVKIVVGM